MQQGGFSEFHSHGVDSANKHGILLEAVQVLTDLNLNINKAYVSSDGNWFMDVFHVTDENGNKLTDEGVIGYIEKGAEVPYTEVFGTFALAVGATVGMEYWARWAHRALWHASLWHMHESHHRPREGPFELNDVFAIINAGPAIALLAYGFFNKGLVPGLCFGAGLGITVFGMAYMFVHDGLVHRRFPVGPIADVPYLLKVAAAHQLHHADKFNGVPYGLFLGPKELEEVGGSDELEKLFNSKIKGLQKLQ